MKKVEVFSDEENNEFRFDIEKLTYSDKSIKVKLITYFDRQKLVISSPEEVDEFCELLQEKKKEIWKQKE